MATSIKSHLQEFKVALKARVPIIAIVTNDPIATSLEVKDCSGSQFIAQWDMIRGVQPMTPLIKPNIDRMHTVDGQMLAPPMVTGNPVEALTRSVEFLTQQGTILLFHNAQMFLEDKPGVNPSAVIQAMANLRDPFRDSNRTLVLLGTSMKLPMELKNDVITIDEPLPDNTELAALVGRAFQRRSKPSPSKKVVRRVVAATSGLAAFHADQVIGMSINYDSRRAASVDIEKVWEHKIRIIEQENGLRVHRGGPSFKDIGGNDNIKKMLMHVVRGSRRPSLVVFLDEIEKVTQGSGRTDTVGVNTDQVKVLLTEMQLNDWDGTICYGFSGTGKSEMAKAFGNEAGCITVEADLGGMKSKWVGDSERQMRAFIKVIKAMASGHVFFIATCNQAEGLAPELKRRFRKGVYFCDLPDQRERDVIWKIHLLKFGLNVGQSRPDDEGWAGAEIFACCQNAAEFGCSLREASKYITVVSQEMGTGAVEAKRKEASGRYLNAHKSGLYVYPTDPIKSLTDSRIEVKGGV